VTGRRLTVVSALVVVAAAAAPVPPLAAAIAAVPPGAAPPVAAAPGAAAPAATTEDAAAAAGAGPAAPVAPVAGEGAAAAPVGEPAADQASSGVASEGAPPAARPAGAPARRGAAIVDPAPRPLVQDRLQNRYTTKAHRLQVYGGASYFARNDFYVSPGLEVGAGYALWEWLGFELQLSRFWSILSGGASEVRQMYGVVPDSEAPRWLLRAGGRLSAGYGKVLVGRDRVIHLEPQLFVHAGPHFAEGSVGFVSDAGISFLFYVTPRIYTRLDLALTLEQASRSQGGTLVLGGIPALVVGVMR
jgi:hypothetical protein